MLVHGMVYVGLLVHGMVSVGAWDGASWCIKQKCLNAKISFIIK